MENKNKNWDQIKQEYKEHTMSEEQVLAMKEKIKQAKKIAGNRLPISGERLPAPLLPLWFFSLFCQTPHSPLLTR